MNARPWYAINARDLLEQRRHGQMPTGPVSVVMGASADPEHPVLYVRDDMPAERLDWRMLVNLHVWLWAAHTVPLERLKLIARRIAASLPAELVLRFSTPDGQLHDVDLGSGTHRQAYPDLGIPAEHSFHWCPVNVGGTPIGARLRRSLR